MIGTQSPNWTQKPRMQRSQVPRSYYDPKKLSGSQSKQINQQNKTPTKQYKYIKIPIKNL